MINLLGWVLLTLLSKVSDEIKWVGTAYLLKVCGSACLECSMTDRMAEFGSPFNISLERLPRVSFLSPLSFIKVIHTIDQFVSIIVHKA